MIADTSFLMDLMRGDQGALRLLDACHEEGWSVHVPSIVLHELQRGVARARRPEREWQRIRHATTGLSVVPHDKEAAIFGGQLDGALTAAGTPIDVEDAIIAAIALRENMPVVTRNVEHFRRVQGLDVVTY